MKKTILLSLLLIIVVDSSRAQLVINELMQSNIDCMMDDLNEFPDSWVELYNNSGSTVNLNQYRLGISNDASKAWRLPSRILGAWQHIVIYCDKVGRDASNGLHTDYRLESGKGCEVYLFQGTTVVDKVTGLKKQPAPNIAYGRKTSGDSEWGYMQTPTPSKGNCGTLCTEILGEPVFSQPGRVMEAGQFFDLSISLPADAPAGTVIRYTVDGREPTITSQELASGSTIQVFTNTVIRAKLFCDGYLSPRSTVHSYIFFPTTRDLTLPVISIVTNNLYLTDSKIGIYVNGSYQNGKRNYEFDWRRPINLEYFEGKGTESILNQLCETRIMGGATRSNALKSLAIYANKRFGEKRFSYEFFPDQRPGVTDYKSLALRDAGNDFDGLYMRDAIIQRSMAQHADLDWQAWRPAILYINGVYKGILNIRERSNEDNVYTNYDGLEDIDMFENWGELKVGTWDNYNAFKNFYNEHGHTLNEYAEWMDWEEFLNLMIMNLYFDNKDFPGNNIVMWRPRAANGRWRWIAKDTDFGLGLYDSPYSYNTIAWLNESGYDNGNCSWANQWDYTRLFRRMMEDEDLKREFTDRCAIYMGDFLNEREIRAIWDPMYDIIKTELPYHRKLFNPWWDNNSYVDLVNRVRAWVKNRTDVFYRQVANYYQTGNPTTLLINPNVSAEDLQRVDITFNGIRLTKGTFDGKFYEGRTVTLRGTPADGKQVTGWTVWKVSSTGTVSSNEVLGNEYSFTMPACQQLIIIAELADDTSGVALPTTRDSQLTDDDVFYDLSGRKLSGRPTQRGIYIVRGKKVVIK